MEEAKKKEEIISPASSAQPPPEVKILPEEIPGDEKPSAPVVVVQAPLDHEQKKSETVEDIKRALDARRRGEDAVLGLSFSGAGFLGAYHFGAVNCLQRNAKTLSASVNHFAGSSVGSLLAALLVFEPTAVEDGLQTLYHLADELNSKLLGALTPGFNMASRLCGVVDAYIPEDISSAQGRLFVSVTRSNDKANKIISDFHSREYLMQCLMASCFVPFYSMGPYGRGIAFDDEIWIDGGLSNNLPLFDAIPTITVSPFSGSAMISPNDVGTSSDWTMRAGDQIIKVNVQNLIRGAQALFPPSRSALQRYYLKGYKNTMLWLINNDLLERNPGSEV